MSYSPPPSNTLASHGPMESDVMPLLQQAAVHTDGLLQRGAEVLHDRQSQLHDHAQQAQNQVRDYVRASPIKSLLFAAAAGATLIGVLRLALRGRSSHGH